MFIQCHIYIFEVFEYLQYITEALAVRKTLTDMIFKTYMINNACELTLLWCLSDVDTQDARIECKVFQKMYSYVINNYVYVYSDIMTTLLLGGKWFYWHWLGNTLF